MLLILLECGSYHHPEEFITLSPSPLPRPGRLRNKSAIVGSCPLSSGALANYSAASFPIIKREGGNESCLPLQGGGRERPSGQRLSPQHEMQPF